MKTSLRTRLFLALSGLLLFFVCLSLIITWISLEKVYIWQKEDALTNASNSIDNIYRGSPADIATELKRFANALGAGIIITDRNGQLKYTSFGPFIHQQNQGTGNNSFKFPPPPPISPKAEKTLMNEPLWKCKVNWISKLISWLSTVG